MLNVQCPIPGCAYAAEHAEASIVSARITAHSMNHAPSAEAKVERVKRPTMTSAGTSEDWAYFQARWNDYVHATKLVGRPKVIQLFECCAERYARTFNAHQGAR